MSLSKGFRQTNKTTPLDFRLAQAGGLVKSIAGAPRTGVLYTPSSDASVVARSSTALRLTLRDLVVLAIARSATDGVDIMTNVGVVNLDFAAPVANSVYATVWAKQDDSSMNDTDDNAVVSVTLGDAAASPAIPAAPTGSTKIGHLLIPSGATTAQSSGVVWTETILGTAPVGAAIRYRSTSEMNADAASLSDGALGYVQSGSLYYLRGGTWRSLAEGSDTGWTTFTPTSSAFDGNSAEPPQYRVLNGVVYLRGQIDAHTGNIATSNITTLPLIARPSGQRWISSQYFGGSVPARIIIDTAGLMAINTNGASSTYVRLDGIQYPVAS